MFGQVDASHAAFSNEADDLVLVRNRLADHRIDILFRGFRFGPTYRFPATLVGRAGPVGNGSGGVFQSKSTLEPASHKGQWAPANQVHRVYRGSVAPDLEVQMGAGGPSGAAQEADDITSAHRLPVFDQDFHQVRISGHVTLLVLEFDGSSVSPHPAGVDHAAGVCGADHRSPVSSEVHPGVESVVLAFRQGVEAVAEGAGDHHGG